MISHVIASASEAIHLAAEKVWIASSRSLSSGAHSRDPLAPRNDDLRSDCLKIVEGMIPLLGHMFKKIGSVGQYRRLLHSVD